MTMTTTTMMITLLHETRSETGIETVTGIKTETGIRTDIGTDIGTEIDTQVDDHHTLERIHTFHSLLFNPILPPVQDQILFLFLNQNTLHLHSILTS